MLLGSVETRNLVSMKGPGSTELMQALNVFACCTGAGLLVTARIIIQTSL